MDQGDAAETHRLVPVAAHLPLVWLCRHLDAADIPIQVAHLQPPAQDRLLVSAIIDKIISKRTVFT